MNVVHLIYPFFLVINMRVIVYLPYDSGTFRVLAELDILSPFFGRIRVIMEETS